MSITVYFDLDNTLFNLYGKENWLEMLENEKPGVFNAGKENQGFLPELDVKKLYNMIEQCQRLSINFGIITWLPFAASPEYEEICRKEKMEWIDLNLPMITDIKIIPYGIEKQKAITKRSRAMYLIDDNTEVCKAWETAKQRKAFQVSKEFTAIDALFEIYNKVVEYYEGA